jgi:hypothetical protein
VADRPNPPRGPLNADGRPTPPIGPLAVAHEQHDALLVAAYAANDLDGRPKDEAAELIAGCSACAELAADLRALATATAALPPVARPRDFGLSPADAARLRPTGWRRLLRALAAPGALTRPLAASLTTLGVAGLLLAALPGMLPMAGSGAAPMLAPMGAPSSEGSFHVQVDRPPASFAPAPSTISGGPAASGGKSPSGSGRDTAGAFSGDDEGPGTSEAPTTDGSQRGDLITEIAVADDGPSTLVVVSGSFLITGLGLFGLRWAGRRLGSG